jgi:hypothetical protein
MDNLDDIESDRLSEVPEKYIEQEWDLESEFGEAPHDPDPLPADVPVRAQYQAIRAVADCLIAQNLCLDEFLDGLCYGNKLCIDDPTTKECRWQLTSSSSLPTILKNLHTPSYYTGARPKAARETIDIWAWEHFSEPK